jgi:hypothetical protein
MCYVNLGDVGDKSEKDWFFHKKTGDKAPVLI